MCGGGIDDELYDPDGLPWTWSACWTACLDKYADALTAIDGPQNGLCYCQDACTHTYDCGVDTAMMTWGDFVVPDTCAYTSDSGILYVEFDGLGDGNEEYRGFTATWSLLSNDTDALAGTATVTCGGICGCDQSGTMSAGTFSSLGTVESAQNTPAPVGDYGYALEGEPDIRRSIRRSTCVDDPDFEDMNGNGCSSYAEDPQGTPFFLP